MRLLILGTMIMIALAPLAHADISKDAAITEFVQGNLSYKEGDHKRAIEKYEAILQGDKASAPLYFNLGNAYYREGRLGKAILSYERAKRLSPRDGDIDFNYEYVRSKANVFEGAVGGTSLLQQMVTGHISFYSVDEMIKLITAILWLMAAVHLLSLYRRWDPRSRRMALSVLFVFFCIFSAGALLKLRLEADRAIILKKAEAKFEPKEDSTTHYSLPEGSAVKVLKEDGGWAKVERPDGKQGWLPRSDLEKL